LKLRRLWSCRLDLRTELSFRRDFESRGLPALPHPVFAIASHKRCCQIDEKMSLKTPHLGRRLALI